MLWLHTFQKISSVFLDKVCSERGFQRFWILFEISPFSDAPSIVYISHDTLANETDEVKLFCNSTGNPRPNITWTFLNGSNSRNLPTGETLILSNVTRNQAGTYQCTAANGLMVPNTANVQVTINCKYNIFGLIIFYYYLLIYWLHKAFSPISNWRIL